MSYFPRSAETFHEYKYPSTRSTLGYSTGQVTPYWTDHYSTYETFQPRRDIVVDVPVLSSTVEVPRVHSEYIEKEVPTETILRNNVVGLKVNTHYEVPHQIIEEVERPEPKHVDVHYQKRLIQPIHNKHVTIQVPQIREVVEEQLRVVEKEVEYNTYIDKEVNKYYEVPITTVLDVPYVVDKIVEKQVVVPIKRIVEVPYEVEVPQDFVVEKIVEEPFDVYRTVPVYEEVEIIKKIPNEIHVDKIVDVHVDKIVPVPVDVTKPEIDHYPVDDLQPKIDFVQIPIPRIAEVDTNYEIPIYSESIREQVIYGLSIDKRYCHSLQYTKSAGDPSQH